MKYDIITLDKWEAPKEDGAALLTMPNVPLPLHGLCPRTIQPKEWEKKRKQCYADADYTCQASKVELGKGHLHAHELYDIDWKHQTSTFRRAVALDPRLHTRFVHSGRALTLFERGDPQMPKSAMLATLEQGFELISNHNRKHYNDEPLRVCDTILDWAKHPELEYQVNQLIKKYKIKFYTFDKKCFDKKHWGKWKLIYDGEKYPTKFATQKDWEEYFNPMENNSNLSILDAILKEQG